MPISRTGNDAEHGFTSSRRSAEHGFTLVELMVVIAIIGMAAGAVMLSLSDRDGDVRRHAEQLAARLTVARDRAIVDGRATVLVIAPGGYGFSQRRGGTMQEMKDRGLRRDTLPEGMQVTLDGRSAGELRFDPTGIADPGLITLATGEARALVRVEADGGVHVDG